MKLSPIMPCVWGQCSDPGRLQLVRSRFSNTMPNSQSAVHLNVLNEQVFPSVDLFFSDDTGRFQDSNSRIHGAQTGTEGVRLDQPQSPDQNPTEDFWDVLEKTVQWSDSPIISTRSW